MLLRPLRKDEEVHHRDEDKRNFAFTNLFVLGSKDHHFVSAKQSYFMRMRDQREKEEWDKFMEAEAKSFKQNVERSRESGEEWKCVDGRLEGKWAAYQQNQQSQM